MLNQSGQYIYTLYQYIKKNHLTYSRWASPLPFCLWSRRIFPSLPGSRLLTSFYRDASSVLLQLVHKRLNFTCSRSHAFRYGRKNTNSIIFTRIELTTSALAGVQVVVVVVVVFTLKTVLTSIQYPSLSYSSRQRNEFPWSHANPK